MKRLARVVGLIGGAVAIVWAMRDRFIKVAISREPEPPVFRVTGSQQPLPVDAVNGIGPIYAKRLVEAGIGDARLLAAANPHQVAEAAGVSTARARTWIDLATGI